MLRHEYPPMVCSATIGARKCRSAAGCTTCVTHIAVAAAVSHVSSSIVTRSRPAPESATALRQPQPSTNGLSVIGLALMRGEDKVARQSARSFDSPASLKSTNKACPSAKSSGARLAIWRGMMPLQIAAARLRVTSGRKRIRRRRRRRDRIVRFRSSRCEINEWYPAPALISGRMTKTPRCRGVLSTRKNRPNFDYRDSRSLVSVPANWRNAALRSSSSSAAAK